MIIAALAVLLALLGGCSALRLGYGQAPQIVHWWLDRYVDLDENQSPRVRDALRDWFRWHRRTQLRDYAALLAGLQPALADTIAPEQVCRLVDEVNARLATAVEQALPAAVELARTLSPQQLEHLERRYARNNAEYRRDFLQETGEERLKASVRRVVDRAETLYGRLDGAQRERIAQLVADSPFDAEGWLVERQRRQQEILQALRRLSGESLTADDARSLLRTVYGHVWRSPRAPYRAYQERLQQYNCSFAAQVHNLTTPEQRRRAVAKIHGWEDDLRTLADGA